MPDLATSRTECALVPGTSGRSLAASRGHHWVIDSPPPLGGPNEEVNPLDMLLSALASCGAFVAETAAREQGVPLRAAEASVESDFDPAAVKGRGGDARLQAIRLNLTFEGPTQAQAEGLVEALRLRCPVFTTLNAAVAIDVRLELRA